MKQKISTLIAIAAAFSSAVVIVPSSRASKKGQLYSVDCAVSDQKGGDPKLLEHRGIFSNEDETTWVSQVFSVRESDDRFAFNLFYESAENVVYLGLTDLSEGKVSRLKEGNPHEMKVDMHAGSASLEARCKFDR